MGKKPSLGWFDHTTKTYWHVRAFLVPSSSDTRVLRLNNRDMGFDARLNPFQHKMELSIEALGKELSGIRAGRASVALLEPIKVEAYGSLMPLNQLASVSAPDARMLAVNVWDKGMVKAVEKAIRECGANLNPTIDGQVIRVPIPPLSEERRQELSKLAAKYAEETKIAIRNIRRDAMDFVKQLEKNGEISEDEMHKLSDAVQELTNDFSRQAEIALAARQKEIMQI
ncbi:MAG: ribosome recycling factor [Holosporales bacterium]|nr:ribosome recycling factor [Holosporales bacterium]